MISPEWKEEVAFKRGAVSDIRRLHWEGLLLQQRSTGSYRRWQLHKDLEKLGLLMKLKLPNIRLLLNLHTCDHMLL